MSAWWWLALLVAVAILVPLLGWIRFIVRLRRRERQFPVSNAPRRPQPAAWKTDQTTLAWLGHATVLMNLAGTRVLTDPVLGDAIGIHLPGRLTLGPRRLVRCPLAATDLPPLDLVLQSHAHMDHLDTRSWRQLRGGTSVVAAPGNARFLPVNGSHPITELAWGETTSVAGLRVTAIEVNHWGERYPWSRGLGYNAYLLERDGRAVLFGGDTALTDSFTRLARQRPIDVAILPIGGYNPFIRYHASPEQTWEMFRAMDARYLVPIHHRTFILSHEHPDEPLQRLLAAAGAEAHRIVIRTIGDSFVLPH